MAILATLVVAGCSGAFSTPPPASTTPSVASPARPGRRAVARPARTDASGVAAGLRPGRYVPDGHRPGGPRHARGRRTPGLGGGRAPERAARARRHPDPGYWIDATEVTNTAFQAFKDAGGYTTESLWSPAGWTWVGHRLVAGLAEALRR